MFSELHVSTHRCCHNFRFNTFLKDSNYFTGTFFLNVSQLIHKFFVFSHQCDFPPLKNLNKLHNKVLSNKLL